MLQLRVLQLREKGGHEMSRPRKPFETCPSCGEQKSIFLMYGPFVMLDGTPGRDRVPAFCNNTRCDQRYWYYPRSASGAYITRRNTGVTYKEWSLARVDLATVNTVRRVEGLPLLALAEDTCPCPVDHAALPKTLDERRAELMPEIDVYPVGECGTEQILGESTVYGWWLWLRSAAHSLSSYLPKRSKPNE